MPRGSVPWPRRNGVRKTAAGGEAAAAVSLELATACGHGDGHGGRPADDVDDAAGCGHTTLDETVHLVDTCGRVIGIRPVPETAAATPRDDDDNRRKQTTAAALTGCPSGVQDDLKHIPPGKSPHVIPQRRLTFSILFSRQ